MPSLFGAFLSIIIAGGASAASAEAAGLQKSPSSQAMAQFVGLLLCFTFAVTTGVITGKIMSRFGAPRGVNVKEFHDAVWWEIGGGEYEHNEEITEEGKSEEKQVELVGLEQQPAAPAQDPQELLFA